MPDSIFFGAPLIASVLNGSINISFVDTAVTRVLTQMFTMGLFDRPIDPLANISRNVTSVAHNTLARKLAASSHVVLKNADNILPLNLNTPQKIVMVGRAALQPITSGGGSGGVFPPYVITPYQGFLNALGIAAPVTSFFCNASKYIKDLAVYQFDCQSIPVTTVEECSSEVTDFFVS